MALELDHQFICAAFGAPQAGRLVSLGLAEGSRNAHPGRGTANRRFFFHNAMLALLWVQDEREVRSEAIVATRLWERSRWRDEGASPFGICLRETSGMLGELPFPTWSYRPPCLPPGVDIPVARTLFDAEPMLFAIPFGERPDAYPPERWEPIEHPLGVHEVTAVRVALRGLRATSDPLRVVERLGIATFVPSDQHLLELSFDGARQGQSADLRPELPLLLRW